MPPHAFEMIGQLGGSVVVHFGLRLAKMKVPDGSVVFIIASSSSSSFRLLYDLVESAPYCGAESTLAVARLAVACAPE